MRPFIIKKKNNMLTSTCQLPYFISQLIQTLDQEEKMFLLLSPAMTPKNLVQWTVNFEEKKTEKGICRGEKSTKQKFKENNNIKNAYRHLMEPGCMLWGFGFREEHTHLWPWLCSLILLKVHFRTASVSQFSRHQYRGRQAMAHWPNMDSLWFCKKKKFYWNTAKCIHLHIDYDCFHTAMAELSGCNRDYVAHRSKIFTIHLFIEKFTNPLHQWVE